MQTIITNNHSYLLFTEQGLELFVGPDGSTALSTHQLRDKAGKFERVIIDNR